MHIELRPKVHARLLELIGTDGISMTEVVERLILSADDRLLRERTEYVHTRSGERRGVA